MVGYKKLSDGQIATLQIPYDAERLNAYGSRKCRASAALVVEMTGRVASKHDSAFFYETGVMVKPTKPLDTDRRVECGAGIHFFITRAEAEAY